MKNPTSLHAGRGGLFLDVGEEKILFSSAVSAIIGSRDSINWLKERKKS